MTSQGTPHGRFQRAMHRRHVQAAEMAAREMGGLSLADALLLCELLAKTDVKRYERAAFTPATFRMRPILNMFSSQRARGCATPFSDGNFREPT
jgi:hypothetical protein